MTTRSWGQALGGLAVAAAVALSTGSARADEPAHSLQDAIRVEAGATCLDAATLVEQVRSWVGADTVEDRVVIEVRGSADQPRVAGFRMVRDGQVIAVRTFDPGPSRCEQLHAVLGLAIAMALKASLIEEVAPTTVPSAAALPPRMPIAAAPAPLPWAVAANAILALAVLPDPGFGVDARIERVLTPTFRARLGVLAVLASGETFDGVPGHFDEWLLAPRLDLCAELEVTRRVRGRGCMGMSGGGLRAQGVSYPSSRSTFIRWLAVANELGVTFDLSRHWSVEADGSLILPVARNSIVLHDYSGNIVEQRDLAPVGWMLGVGPLVRF
jgi:hypothetical protein